MTSCFSVSYLGNKASRGGSISLKAFLRRVLILPVGISLFGIV